jgi:hypothetical protein
VDRNALARGMSLAAQWPIRITVSLPRTSGRRSDQLGRAFSEIPGAEQTEIGRRGGGAPPPPLDKPSLPETQ